MKSSIRLIILIAFLYVTTLSIGAFYIPASGYIDSYRVQFNVELQAIEYLSKSSDTSDEELIKHHEAILEIANQHCSKEEIAEIDDLFYKFLDSKGEKDLNHYAEKSDEYIVGKPNFFLFFLLIILIIGGIFVVPSIKKKRNLKYHNYMI